MNLTPTEIYLVSVCGGLLGVTLLAWSVSFILSLLFGFGHLCTEDGEKFRKPFLVSLIVFAVATLVATFTPTREELREMFIAAHQTQEASK